MVLFCKHCFSKFLMRLSAARILIYIYKYMYIYTYKHGWKTGYANGPLFCSNKKPANYCIPPSKKYMLSSLNKTNGKHIPFRARKTWASSAGWLSATGGALVSGKVCEHTTECMRLGIFFQQTMEHSGSTRGLLWDRFGLTFGLLPEYIFLVRV